MRRLPVEIFSSAQTVLNNSSASGFDSAIRMPSDFISTSRWKKYQRIKYTHIKGGGEVLQQYRLFPNGAVSGGPAWRFALRFEKNIGFVFFGLTSFGLQLTFALAYCIFNTDTVAGLAGFTQGLKALVVYSRYIWSCNHYYTYTTSLTKAKRFVYCIEDGNSFRVTIIYNLIINIWRVLNDITELKW